MFEKCIECPRIGESCVPNLWLLPFPELFKWCVKRQKFLGWSNQHWADDSDVPVGTINRLKSGDTDCKYSTMRSLAISVIGGTRNEFACTEQVEQLAQQAAKMTATEAECEMLRERLNKIDEQHRQDIRVIRDEYREQITFLKDELKSRRRDN